MEIDKEISAEMLLGYLYPEKISDWKVSCLGTFFRNYNYDVIFLDPENDCLELSRDGFLKYLPDGMLSDPDELEKARDKSAEYERINFRRHLLSEAFSPLDDIKFKERLQLEKQISSVLEDKVEIILREYFGLELNDEPDPLVRQVKMWLPYIKDFRGDLHFVKILLKKILGYEVEIDLSHRFSESESTRSWLPEARYTVIIPGLSAEGFREKKALLAPLEKFIREWFIPFDVNFVLNIRPHASSVSGDCEGILDYNCELQL